MIWRAKRLIKRVIVQMLTLKEYIFGFRDLPKTHQLLKSIAIAQLKLSLSLHQIERGLDTLRSELTMLIRRSPKLLNMAEGSLANL